MQGGRDALSRYFGGADVHLFGSGTEALTAVLAECASEHRTSTPEAVIPAYGCPDLVSACVGAGVFPRLVDVAVEGWGYDLRSLSRSLSSRTVAVVAVNLLGVGDDAASLANLSRDVGAALIQDSAQHLPRNVKSWPGDFQILSFGRGKPLNLLRGGAAIGPLRQVAAEDTSIRSRILETRVAALLFNVATHPRVYPWLTHLPGLSLGATRYHRPRVPTRLPERAWKQLDIAFPEYQSRLTYTTQPYQQYMEAWDAIGLPRLCSATGSGSSADADVLRLAMLAPSEAMRNRLVSHLEQAGLGASAFYGKALSRIESVPDVVRAQGPFPNAENLAGRLFTLPTHQGVDAGIAARTDEVLQSLVSDNHPSGARA
jgi:dTDP-4-amino-4,6-dideoxygalactose transaminase